MTRSNSANPRAFDSHRVFEFECPRFPISDICPQSSVLRPSGLFAGWPLNVEC